MTQRFEANPQYYDYIHSVRLHEDGTCELLDGGGQCMNSHTRGTYTREGSVVHFQIEGKKFDVSIVEESGLFVFLEGVPANFIMEEQVFLIYRKRYIFDKDPFEEQYKDRRSLYWFINGAESDKETRNIFYLKGETKEFRHLSEEERLAYQKIDPEWYELCIQYPKLRRSEVRKKLNTNS